MKYEEIMRKQLEAGVLKLNLKGTSMLPAYKQGDSVYITKPSGEIKINDIVLFHDGGEMILHRVVQVIGNYIITKGDHNSYLDRPVRNRDILGVVCKDPKA